MSMKVFFIKCSCIFSTLKSELQFFFAISDRKSCQKVIELFCPLRKAEMKTIFKA